MSEKATRETWAKRVERWKDRAAREGVRERAWDQRTVAHLVEVEARGGSLGRDDAREGMPRALRRSSRRSPSSRSRASPLGARRSSLCCRLGAESAFAMTSTARLSSSCSASCP